MLKLSRLKLTPGAPEAEEIVFQKGAINVVLGSNHSGKTALCRFLCGLATNVSGTVFVNGEELLNRSDRMKRTSLVYQAFVNYPNWSVRDNIASPLKAGSAGKLGRGHGAGTQGTPAEVVGRLLISNRAPDS